MTAETAAFAAKRLARELSVTEELAKASCELGSACLQFAATRIEWADYDDLVRDKGALRWRELLSGQCATIAILLSDALRKLLTHRNEGNADSELADKLEALAEKLAATVRSISECEEELKNRLHSPSVTIAGLEEVVKKLKGVPQKQKEEMRALTEKIDIEESKLAAKKTELNRLLDAAALQERIKNQINTDKDSAEVALKKIQADLESIAKSADKARAGIAVQTLELEMASARAGKLRQELVKLESDPRREIMAAITRAINELPADSFDKSFTAKT